MDMYLEKFHELNNFLLIKGISYGGICPNKVFEDAKYYEGIVDFYTTIVHQNKEQGFISNAGKTNMLKVLDYFRWGKEYNSSLEKQKMWNWCNEMIGMINSSSIEENNTKLLSEMTSHGFLVSKKEVINDTISSDYKKLLEEQTHTDFLLNNYIMLGKEKKINMYDKEFALLLCLPYIETSIVYFVNEHLDMIDNDIAYFFNNIITIKKIIVENTIDMDISILLENNDQKHDCVFSKEICQHILSNTELALIRFAENMLEESCLRPQIQKIKKLK